jgi:selenide,water dikinase
LIFTKELGTGVISTAIKKKAAKQSWIDAAIASMITLNKKAAEVISGSLRPGQAEKSSTANDQRPRTNDRFAVHAMTDVTGFGLIGHAREIAIASSVSLRFYANRIPLLEGALECVRAGHIPGGLKANREFAECVVKYEDGVSEELKTILFDPQTAGGLLISVAAEDATKLTQALVAAKVPAIEIGEVLPNSKPLITVQL